MPDNELTQLIAARVLSELQAPAVNASEPDRSPYRSYAEEARACRTTAGMRLIPIGISARHAHVTQEHLAALFGTGHHLGVHAHLYQPGEFAARETVAVVGPRMRAIESVRILGPVRPYTQVEFSRTDCVTLGLDAPIRTSGDLDDAEAVTLVGPHGSIRVRAAICPTRHVHLNPAEASYYGVEDRQDVSVHVGGDRALTLELVRVRVHPKVVAQMHLDTDDANAAGLRGGEGVEITVC
jgi:putative phosphotransacetylase